jgi:hypothetical protein
MFCRKLWICRDNGMNAYMGMASRYVEAFDRRWIRAEEASGEAQLGTGDIQSLADLTNSVNVVRNMRRIPVGGIQLTTFLLSVMAPLFPLLFLKYPVEHIGARVFEMFTGL